MRGGLQPGRAPALTGCGDISRHRGEARLWEAATGKPVGQPLRQKGYVTAVAFSPDGRLALTGSGEWDRGGTARLWEVATGKPVGQLLRHEMEVTAVAFSPDGRLVLTGSKDKTARLWETATGNSVGQPLRHQDYVYAAAFSPDGRLALTGSKDKTARLWEVATGKPVGQPLRHEGPVYRVAFSPDGRLALTGSADHTARLWEVVPPAPDKLAQVRAWVHVRTRKAFNDQGILEELSQEEWLRAWQELDANGGDFQAPQDPRRWHLAQAAQDWFAAAFHLKRLLEMNPEDSDLRGRLDTARANLRK